MINLLYVSQRLVLGGNIAVQFLTVSVPVAFSVLSGG